MTTLEKAKIARTYYEQVRGKNVVQGCVKLILTDGKECLFVNEDYKPKGEEVVFRVETRNCETQIELYRIGE